MSMNASANGLAGKGFTGRHVLYCMFGFFGVIIAVNMVFLTYALQTFPGESMKKSYLQGLHYNDILAERAEQATLGWRAELVEANGEGVIEVRLTDAGGAPLNGLTVNGELRRIVHARDDRALSFTAMGEGLYRAPAGALEPGVWSLTAHAESRAGEALDFTARVDIR